ncbi:hypothetical protein HOD20_05355 [archaeon]|jgi:hypothetical protein|nr:hypothetical protein [archaeon]MBT4647479.1 hypothetical protein [archaeon]MBT6822024.1 hypothetical protein [archaeon]MBT7391618.1 hypothetical protein [archaeon]
MTFKKGNVKLKILFFFVFFVSFILLASWVTKFYYQSTEIIDEDLKRTSCQQYDFEIKEIKYENKNLIFEIRNNKLTSEKIDIINILSGEGLVSQKQDTPIEVSDSKFIQIKDIELQDSVTIYIQNCPENNRTFTI